MKRTIARLARTSPASAPGSLDDQILTAADTLTQLLERAAALHQPIPPPIANTVHDLRGWASRIGHSTTGGPAAVDAGRLLTYLRGLPDQQLLAVLADLPWSRLDALLDAVNLTHHTPSGGGTGR